MIRYLSPWHENINKRQVKSPKIYFRDSGILHSLLSLEDKTALLHHPKLGASWEGFALEEIIRHSQVDIENCFFWAIHSQAELDLLIFKNGKRIGFEIKHTDAPRLTGSMQTSMELLKLDKLIVIYPGDKNYLLAQHIQVFGLKNYLKDNPL